MVKNYRRISVMVSGILIFLVLMNSLFIDVSLTNKNESEEIYIEPLISVDNISNNSNIERSLDKPNLKESQQEEWALGETVKTTFSSGNVDTEREFISNTFQSEVFTHPERSYSEDSISKFGSIQNLERYDNQNYSVRLNTSLNREVEDHINYTYFINIDYVYHLYTDLEIILNSTAFQYTDSPATFDRFDWLNESFTFTLSNRLSIDNRVKLKVFHTIDDIGAGGDPATRDYNYSTSFSVYNYFSGEYDNVHTTAEMNEVSLVDISEANVNGYLQIDIEALRISAVVQEILHAHYRTEYITLNQSVILHRLFLENFAANIYFYIYSPLNWNLSLINPGASFFYDTTEEYYVIYDVQAITYTIYFTEESSRYYLATSDVTSEYLQDLSFEGSYKNDWIEWSGSGFDSVSLNSSIVSEGAFSLRLEDTEGTSDYIRINSQTQDLPFDYYYISFDYYIESITDYLYFRWSDASNSKTLDTTSNRWINEYVFCHVVDNDNYHSFEFKFGVSGVVFIDNFRIWRVNTETKTIEENKIETSGKFIDWETQKGLSNHNIEIAYYDRCDQSLIFEDSLITNENGYFEYEIDTSVYTDFQIQKEIECRVWSWESQWDSGIGVNDEGYTEDLDINWNDALGTITESLSTDSVEGDYSILAEGVGRDIDGWWRMVCDFGVQYDFTNIDYIIISMKVNDTSNWQYSSSIPEFSHSTTSEGSTRRESFRPLYNSYDYETLTTTWTEYHFDRTGDFPQDYNYRGSDWDETSVGEFFLTIRPTVEDNTTSISVWFDNYHVIQSCKSYFTPIGTTDFPFYYEKESDGYVSDNEIDFSYETEEIITGDARLTINYVNGYLNASRDAYDANYLVIYLDTSNFDFSEYTGLSMRVFWNTNDSDTDMTYSLCDTSWSKYYFSSVRSLGTKNEYSVLYEAFTANSDYDSSSSRLIFYAEDASQLVYLKIDYIRFIKRIIPSLTLADSYAYTTSSNNSFNYKVISDNQLLGYASDLTNIPLNLTTDDHNLTVVPYQDYLRKLVFLKGDSITAEYEVVVPGIMKILLHDQGGNILNFDQFKVYIDSVRLYDQYVHFTDTSQSFNLTISDLFDNLVYQDTTEDYEEFKEIELTLYSVKIQNLQDYPVWVKLERSGREYSEWIFSWEIIEYHLEAATYDITFYYSDTSDFAAALNGTSIQYSYAIAADTAIRITGKTIQDVWGNVISLTDDLDSMNSSIHVAIDDQSENITLQFIATNQFVTFILDNSSLIIDQLFALDVNLLGNFTAIISKIDSETLNIVNSLISNTTFLSNQLNANFSSLQTTILSNNTVLFSQTVTILEKLAEIQGIFRVHFSVIDSLGIGLDWNTILLNVNSSRQFDQDLYVLNNSFYTTTAYDWFNVELWTDSFTITEITEVNITVDLYESIFINNGSYTSYVQIYRNSIKGINLSILPDSSVSVRMTSGSYEFNVYYYTYETQETDKLNPSIYDYNRTLLKTGNFIVSASLPSKFNVSSPTIKVPVVDQVLAQITIVWVIVAIMQGVLTLTAGYFVTNFLIRRAIGRHAKDPGYEGDQDWLDKALRRN